jgi:NADH:ubiquinone oxidoreductase subunit 2 (subunit N)
MPEWILFLPVLVLPVATLVFALVASRVTPQARVWLPIALLALEIAAVLVNIAPVEHRVAFSEWPLASFSLVFQIDGPGLVLLLMVFVVLLALWLVAAPRTPFDPLAAFVYCSAILLLLAGNFATVYFAWVLLDIALFLWRLVRDIERGTALRALAVSQLAGLMVFAGAVFAQTPFAAQGGWLIALAFWARLGLFPFHWILPMRGTDSRDLWTGRGVPLIAGAGLWIHWGLLQGSATRFPVGWVSVLAALALLTAVVWSWHEEQPSRVAAIATWHAVAFIPLGTLYGGEGGVAYAFWLTLASALALGTFELAMRWRAESRNHWPRLVWFGGILLLAGLPLTPAFVGRAGVYVALLESGAWWLVVIAGTVTALTLVPLWKLGLSLAGSEPRTATLTEAAGLALLILAYAALGLAPMPIAQSLAEDFGAAAQVALDRIVSPNDFPGVAIAALVLVAPVILSLLWSERTDALRQQSSEWLAGIARVSDLDWLAQLLSGSGYQMSRIARNTITIVEENPTVWLLLVALWIAIFVLLPR